MDYPVGIQYISVQVGNHSWIACCRPSAGGCEGQDKQKKNQSWRSKQSRTWRVGVGDPSVAMEIACCPLIVQSSVWDRTKQRSARACQC
jgi:hypothetical protein